MLERGKVAEKVRPRVQVLVLEQELEKAKAVGKALVTGRGSDGAVDAVADAAEESVDLEEGILAGGTDMDIPIGIQDRPIDEGGGGLAGQAGAVHMAVLAY